MEQNYIVFLFHAPFLLSDHINCEVKQEVLQLHNMTQGKKNSSNVMYLCSGIKWVVNVINQTNRRLGKLMQIFFHSDPLIKQETQGVKYLVEFTEVKGWSLPGWVPQLTHSILFPGQWDSQS